MAADKHFLLLALGLCLVVSHSLSTEVKVYGGDPKNPYEDVTWQLEKQRNDKEKLETLLKETTNPEKSRRIQKDIERISSTIAKMEVNFRVVYKDHIEAIKSKTQDLESEKAKLKKKLEAAEERHAKAVADMQEAKENDTQQISVYQAKLEESTNQLEKLERDYAAIKEIQTQQLEKEKEEKEQLIKVKDELTKKLQNAQNLHAKAMQAISMSIARQNEKPSLSHENAILTALRNSASSLRNTPNKRIWSAGYNALQAALESFYDSLYKEGHLPISASHQELENALNLLKQDAKNKKTEQTKHRRILVDQILKKNFGDYTEEDIEDLVKVNREVDTTDLILGEIARRKSFLKLIKEVALLRKEATDGKFKFMNPRV